MPLWQIKVQVQSLLHLAYAMPNYPANFGQSYFGNCTECLIPLPLKLTWTLRVVNQNRFCPLTILLGCCDSIKNNLLLANHCSNVEKLNVFKSIVFDWDLTICYLMLIIMIFDGIVNYVIIFSFDCVTNQRFFQVGGQDSDEFC